MILFSIFYLFIFHNRACFWNRNGSIRNEANTELRAFIACIPAVSLSFSSCAVQCVCELCEGDFPLWSAVGVAVKVVEAVRGPFDFLVKFKPVRETDLCSETTITCSSINPEHVSDRKHVVTSVYTRYVRSTTLLLHYVVHQFQIRREGRGRPI